MKQLVLDLLVLRGGLELGVEIVFQHLTHLFDSWVKQPSISRLTNKVMQDEGWAERVRVGR